MTHDRIDRAYVGKIRRDILAYAEKRRQIIVLSDDALHHAKRAIFALHRHDPAEAKKKLMEARERLVGAKRIAKNAHASDEGSYKAAVEEFVEATIFFQFVTSGYIGRISAIPVSNEQYLAGLCDVPGELLRYAINAATERDMTLVASSAAMAKDIVGELIECNLTSYLRTKFDQAKQAVHKLEQIVYETTIRGLEIEN
ncbi:MAG: hypothetical protein AAB932_04360 [Patescibacteria group bacterium]